MRKVNMFQKLLIITVLVLPFTVLAKNPVNPPSASNTFSGMITDKVTQEHLSGVYLYFNELGKGVYSGSDGKFNLEGIVPGNYNVTLKYISYHEKHVSVKVKKSKKNHKTIQLEPVQP
jgi:hypothetical protein